MARKAKTILFSGGGTLGSVTPLLAVADVLKRKRPNTTLLWVGTQTGPERALIEDADIAYYPITSGKLRRYISLKNITDLFRTGVAIIRSMLLLSKHNPDLCVTAGGYVSVPVHIAARLMRIPCWVHQQDIEIGLANKIMAKSASLITVALKSQEQAFAPKRARVLGNPVRDRISHGDAAKAKKIFGITTELPVLLVMGGGTGAAQVNDVIVQALPTLLGHVEVIHLYGKTRDKHLITEAKEQFEHYHPCAFITDEMKDALAAADVIVSRAGFGALSEFAALSKAVILLPKEGHQEKNAAYFANQSAALVLSGDEIHPSGLVEGIHKLLKSEKTRTKMGAALSEALPTPSSRQLLHAVDTASKRRR